MISSIKVQILFSFKGVSYSPAAIIEFDKYLEKNLSIPEFFHLVARENSIDIYSYQYEVMEMGKYQYSDAQGLATEFCQNDNFDLAGFEKKWKEVSVLGQLSKITKQNLDIHDLDENEALKNTLLQAYQLGLKNSSS